MAIKSVNGKNVYVIDVEVPTPRTSTGSTYGNLVSELRWDLFDKLEKNMLRTADIERLGYQSELEAYRDGLAQLRASAAKLRQAKIDLQTGGGSDEFYKTLRAENKARVDIFKAQSAAAAGGGGGTRTETYYSEDGETPAGTAGGQRVVDRYGEAVPLGAQRKITIKTPTGDKPSGKAPEAPELLTVAGEPQTAKDLEAQLAARKDEALSWIDAEIAKIESEIKGSQAPAYTGTTDFTTAGRRAFAQGLGEGGFGLQPRRLKVQPTYYESEVVGNLAKREDEAIAKELQDTIAYREQYARDIIASNPKIRDLKMRLAEFEAIAPTTDVPLSAEIANFKAQIAQEEAAIMAAAKLTPEDEKDIISRARNRMVSEYDRLGAVDVTRREFLSPYRDRDPRDRDPRSRDPRKREPKPKKPEIPEIPPTELKPLPDESPLVQREPVVDGKGPPPQLPVPFVGGVSMIPGGSGIEVKRKPRIPQNPPGTDRDDPFFWGPRGVPAPEEAEIPGPETAFRLDPSLGDKVELPPYEEEEIYRLYGTGTGQDKNAIGAEEMVQAQAAEEAAAKYGEVDKASARAAAEREEEFRALLGEDYQQMPRPAGGRSSYGRMEPSPRAQMPVERRGGEVVPFTRRPGGLADRRALGRLGMDKGASGVDQPAEADFGRKRGDLPGNESDVGPDFGTPEYFEGYNAPPEFGTPEYFEEYTPPVTKQSRKDLYRTRIIKKGLELAEKPSKVERLAKTNLDPKERDKKAPQYIIIVDKLFEINRGKPNAFEATYGEINRVFAAAPKERAAAHEYLVSKDTLEKDAKAPVA